MAALLVVTSIGLIALAGESTCYCVSAPDSIAACLGETVTFSVTASGDGPLTYQWYHGSTPLSDGGRVAGATGSELRIEGVEGADVGEYTVTVSGSRGMVTSLPATLTVKAPTVITSPPEDVSVCPGTDVAFSVGATGEGTLAYQWSHDSSPLSDGGRISGATTSRIEIAGAEDSDAGRYSVTVTGECGPATSAATLTVKAPTVITNPPEDVSVCPGTDVVFSVGATGEGTLAYQWDRDSAPLSDSGRISGATSAHLEIADAEDADAGQYTVTVTGECGPATATAATLTVKAPTVITDPPEDLSVCPGTDVAFSVGATGEGTLAYQWNRDSAPLSDGGRISGATSARLEIADVEDADAGQYTVTVTGECGPATATAATLTVKAPTMITASPVDVSVYSGEAASFAVTASGEGLLSYQWYHDSAALADGERISGATSAQLEIVDVEDADAGDYTVTVTGECGEATSSIARLTVRQPMGSLEVVLSKQPKDVLVILDLSSSMEEELEGGTKIALAKSALQMLFKALPGSTEVGLRTFLTCGRSDLVVPIQPVSTGLIAKTVKGLETAGKTPLAYTLRQIPGDLEGLKGPHVVVFITDGTETCQEDPVAAARGLVAARLDIIFRLVGFDIARAGGQSAQDQLTAIADAAGGVYLDVGSGDELVSTVIALVLPPSYSVYDSAGKLVKEGIVGDASFDLPTGTYSVAIGTDPEQVFGDVTVRLDKTTTVTVK